MNENSYKSVISALAGAIVVLLLALIFLFLIGGESEQVTAPRAIIADNKVQEHKEDSVLEKQKEPEAVTEAFDSFGVLENNDSQLDEKSVREAPLTNKSQGPEPKKAEKLEPLKVVSESDALAKLDSIINQQKEKIKKPAKVKEEEPKKVPVKETPEPKKEQVVRRVLSPGEDESIKSEMTSATHSDLESLALDGNRFFSVSQNDFDKSWLRKTNAVWTDNIRSSARSTTPMNFADFASLETVFSFRKSKLKKLTLMVYNKGDIGFITKRNFDSVKNDVLNKLTAFLGEKPLFKPFAGITRNNIYFWNINNVLYKLEYSFTETSKDFFSEYIRVVVTKGHPGINVINIDQANTDVVTEADLRDMVTRESNGDVIINGIPMVDQGEKGYCACAALARLMIYFGRDFDQHDIAKLAETTGSEGSDPKSLKKAIETMSAMLRLNMKVLAKCYMSDTTTSKMKEKLENIKEGMTSNYLNTEVFKQMAYGNRRYKEFAKNVMNSIDRGRPVAWALEVGMVPEKGIPQSSGGHMRIITGYNKAKEVIYYTDSWGAGHEKKSMDMNSAFFVSYAFWEISPR